VVRVVPLTTLQVVRTLPEIAIRRDRAAVAFAAAAGASHRGARVTKLPLSRRCMVGDATVKRSVRQLEHGGHVAPKPHGGGMPRAVDAQAEALIPGE
jgi:transposase